MSVDYSRDPMTPHGTVRIANISLAHAPRVRNETFKGCGQIFEIPLSTAKRPFLEVGGDQGLFLLRLYGRPGFDCGLRPWYDDGSLEDATTLEIIKHQDAIVAGKEKGELPTAQMLIPWAGEDAASALGPGVKTQEYPDGAPRRGGLRLVRTR